MFLVRAVVHVSHDAITGTDQTAKAFWDGVFQQYDKFVPGTERTVCSIQNRWKKELQPTICKFVGHFTTIRATERSGWKEDDYVTETLKLYNEIEKRPFEHVLVWDYLRQKVPKFEDGLLSGSTPSIGNRSKRCRPEEVSVPSVTELISEEQDRESLK